MRLFQVVWDYIQGSLLTTQGDIVKRGAAVNARMGVGNPKEVLGVTDSGNDLLYRPGIEIVLTKGDLIKRGAVVAQRFSIGAAKKVLGVNNAGDDLEYRDGIEIATVKGDLIKRGAAACAKLAVGAANLILAVNAAGDDLEYRNHLSLPSGSQYSSENAGIVTLINALTPITTLNFGTPTTGAIFIINTIVTFTKGGTPGNNVIRISKTSGTAVIQTFKDLTLCDRSDYVIASAGFNMGASFILRVTTGGTLELTFAGQSLGSDSTVQAGDGQIYALTIKS